jgi:hypothetical protein
LFGFTFNIRFLPAIVAEKNATKNFLKDGRTDGKTEGRTEVKQYTSPLRWSGGIYAVFPAGEVDMFDVSTSKINKHNMIIFTLFVFVCV